MICVFRGHMIGQLYEGPDGYLRYMRLPPPARIPIAGYQKWHLAKWKVSR